MATQVSESCRSCFSVVELRDPCPLRHVRQTHESVRRLPYWCSGTSFRGVLGSGVRLRVDVCDSRECRAAEVVTSRHAHRRTNAPYAVRG